MRKPQNRVFLGSLAVAATMLLLPVVVFGQEATSRKPNVLFIAVDDLRTQLGCYGHKETLSPNIDKLASQGLVFNRAYCQVPVCGASRASLLTGIRPTPTRFVTFFSRVDEDAPRAVTLPEAFKNHGYYTISDGKIFHHNNDTQKRSWSEPAWRPKGGRMFLDEDSAQYTQGSKNGAPFFEHPDVPDDAYPDGKIAEKTISDLRRLKEMGKPFFLACGFFKPHLPFYAPKKYWDMYERERIAIAGNRYRPKNAPASLCDLGEIRSYHHRNIEYNSPDFHKAARHGYYACVSYVDAQIGKVLAELDRLDLRANTIVILWGDHGWNLGEHGFWSKHNLLHNVINAPLIISVPGVPGNRRNDALVEFVDIYPTLCELAGIPLGEPLEGKSFVPLLTNPDAPWKATAFTRYRKGDAVSTERYTYTEYNLGGTIERMLYDHRVDAAENTNIAQDPENAPLVERMSRLLLEGRSRVPVQPATQSTSKPAK